MAEAHVGLNVPVGGEVFVVGEAVRIEWIVFVPHTQDNWDLFFSPDGGDTWEDIEIDLPVSQLSYQWVVPNITTDEAQIRIYMDNLEGTQNYSAISGEFSIRETMISVQEEGAVSLSFTLYPGSRQFDI